MAEPTSIAGFFELEWARFWQGVEGLSPEAQLLELQKRAKERARSGQENTVSLPGWDQVIHITPRYNPSAAERKEYYDARRQNRPAQITGEAATAIEARRASAQRIASSAAPPYAQAWGQMLTAIDNVQDFTTTVATLGRLALYPAIGALNAAMPRFGVDGWARHIFGATPEAAESLAKVAARQAASDAFLKARAASLAEYAAASAAGLERSALLAAGREAAELAAGTAARLAYRSTLNAAARGLGSRALGWLIPGLGWILAIGDLLNILAYLGQIGMVGYVGSCFGPGKALAALGPQAAIRGKGLLGPCGIKGKVAQMADINPFASKASATRAMKLRGAAPSLGNLLEVAQTTDQIYGVGLSFGAIVGAFTEGAYAAELNARGQGTSISPGFDPLGTAGVVTGIAALQLKSYGLGALAAGSLLLDTLGRTATAPLREKHNAAKQLQSAPAINGTQETFSEYEHLEQLVNYTHALDLVASDLAPLKWQDWLAHHLPMELSPPQYYDPLTLAIIAETDPHGATLGRWPMEGAPRVVGSDDFIRYFSREIPHAVRDFLAPRRADPVGMFAGGCYNFIAAETFRLLEPDPGFLRSTWTPEWKILTALGETARLVDVNVDPATLWNWWQDALELADAKALQQISSDDLDRLGAKHGVQLIRVEEFFLRSPFG